MFRNRFFILLFSKYAWYRKYYGGHWEGWYLDFPVCSILWFQRDHCTEGVKPNHPLIRGGCICQEYKK